MFYPFLDAAFLRLAEQYGVTLAGDDTEFFLAFQNPDHAIWCANNENDFIVGLTGSLHHEHYFYMEEAQEEIESIRTEKKVHMIFYDGKEAQHWNDLYTVRDLDSEISARFYPTSPYESWWERGLRIIFLVSPSFTPEVLRAEIYSYRGTYDRTVFKNG